MVRSDGDRNEKSFQYLRGSRINKFLISSHTFRTRNNEDKMQTAGKSGTLISKNMP